MKSGIDQRTRTKFIYIAINEKMEDIKKVNIPIFFEDLEKEVLSFCKKPDRRVVIKSQNGVIIKNIDEIIPGETYQAIFKEKLRVEVPKANLPEFDPSNPLLYVDIPIIESFEPAESPNLVSINFEKGRRIKKNHSIVDSRLLSVPSAYNSFSQHQASDSISLIDGGSGSYKFFDPKKFVIIGDDGSHQMKLDGSNIPSNPFKLPESDESVQKGIQLKRLSDLTDAIKFVTGVNSLDDVVLESIKTIKKETESFIVSSISNEEQIKNYWRNNTIEYINEFFENVPHNIYFEKQVKRKLLNHVHKHRMISGTNSLFSIKSIVYGPPHSGKSYILQLLSIELINELYCTENWKKQVIVPLNIEKWTQSFLNIYSIYLNIINCVFSALISQKVGFRELINCIWNYYMSILEKENKLSIPKEFKNHNRFADEIIRIGESIKIWLNNELSLESTINQLLTLPNQIIRCFGYSNVIFVIDNIDFIDIELHPNDNQSNTILFSEHFKYFLHHTNFILTSRDSYRLLNLSNSADQYGLDLMSQTDFFYTYGIINDKVSDQEFIFSLYNDDNHYTLNESMFGGVPLFLQIWQDFLDVMNEYQRTSESNQSRKEELLLYGISLLEPAIQQVFDGFLDTRIESISFVHY